MEEAIKKLLYFDTWAEKLPFVPGWIFSLIVMGLVAVVILALITVMAMILIWLERKISGRIQRRMGPMLLGPRWLGEKSMWLGGFFQIPADIVKLLLKEDIIPTRVDRWVFIAAPFVMFTATILGYLVIPWGGFAARDLNIGIIYILAVSSYSVIAIIMAGWSSNNKYSLLGGLRSAAQIISYEIPLLFSVLGVVMLAGSLKMSEIVMSQKGLWFIIPQIIAFFVYIIAANAEVNRPPFDIPEAESELVSGFNIEYSGMRFAMFFLAEFANMFLAAAIAVVLFLGGWLLPFGINLPVNISLMGITITYFSSFAHIIIFFVKTYMVVLLFMWIRWTFPRLRPDQLMGFAWKFLLPVSFFNLILTAIFLVLKW